MTWTLNILLKFVLFLSAGVTLYNGTAAASKPSPRSKLCSAAVTAGLFSLFVRPHFTRGSVPDRLPPDLRAFDTGGLSFAPASSPTGPLPA